MVEVDIKEAAKTLAAENLTEEQKKILSDLIDEVLETRMQLAKLTGATPIRIPKGTESPKIPIYPCDPVYPIEPGHWYPNKTGISWNNDNTDELKHKTLKERLEEFYGLPFDEIQRSASEPEVDWGPPQGEEVW